MLIRVTRPSAAAAEAVLAALGDRDVTYEAVGMTATPSVAPGYRRHTFSTPLGSDRSAFPRGQEALRTWQCHRHAGITLTPVLPPILRGTVVVCTLRLGPVWVLAPCRIVFVTEEPDRFGFGYGTLPGHPECGEESFHVCRHPSDQVTFEIVACSRPGDRLVQLAGPVGRALQHRAGASYLEGVRRYVIGA